MQTRRQFVARAGAAAVAPSSCPPSRARSARAPEPAAKGGSFAEGVISRRPDPERDHAVDARRRRRRHRRASSSRSRATRASASVVARQHIVTTRRRSTTRSRRASAASSRTSSTTTASPPGRRTVAGRALPHRAAGGLQPAGHASRSSPARTTRTATTTRTTLLAERGRRLRRQPRRLHLRRRLPLRRADGVAATPDDPHRRASRPLQSEYRDALQALPHRRARCGRCTRSSR